MINILVAYSISINCAWLIKDIIEKEEMYILVNKDNKDDFFSIDHTVSISLVTEKEEEPVWYTPFKFIPNDIAGKAYKSEVNKRNKLVKNGVIENFYRIQNFIICKKDTTSYYLKIMWETGLDVKLVISKFLKKSTGLHLKIDVFLFIEDIYSQLQNSIIDCYENIKLELTLEKQNIYNLLISSIKKDNEEWQNKKMTVSFNQKQFHTELQDLYIRMHDINQELNEIRKNADTAMNTHLNSVYDKAYNSSASTDTTDITNIYEPDSLEITNIESLKLQKKLLEKSTCDTKRKEEQKDKEIDNPICTTSFQTDEASGNSAKPQNMCTISIFPIMLLSVWIFYIFLL